MNKLMHIAQDLGNKPVLFHTGLFKSCHASIFEDICKNYNETKIVLAHGRPIDETVFLMNKFENVYVDTAFMPISDLLLLKKYKLIDRVLFGSDLPITGLYTKEESMVTTLKNQIMETQKICPAILTNTVYE